MSAKAIELVKAKAVLTKVTTSAGSKPAGFLIIKPMVWVIESIKSSPNPISLLNPLSFLFFYPGRFRLIPRLQAAGESFLKPSFSISISPKIDSFEEFL
jgi:hypothetical protein